MFDEARAQTGQAEAEPAQSDRDRLKQLQKENRILQKQLERANRDRAKLEEMNRNQVAQLKKVIFEVQASQSILEKKSSDLEQAFQELKMMQDKLVESEKMSALGTLVAGVAHEINTPVGTSITLASTLADETAALMSALTQGQLKRSVFRAYLDTAAESSQLLLANLNRAGDLVQSFKQVAVDQASLERRTFRIKAYLKEIVLSLSPHLRKTHHAMSVTGDEALEIDSYPGAIAQIVTNLITNSLIHAFAPGERGQLQFVVATEDNYLCITYRDNGCGIPAENLSKIFNPFFTTGRAQGGTGLGLHIVYNLVTQTLGGQIDVWSELGQGSQFQLRLPMANSP
jgi:two-component system, NtrC family, sensor kinase